jgi:hypothetical protein
MKNNIMFTLSSVNILQVLGLLNMSHLVVKRVISSWEVRGVSLIRGIHLEDTSHTVNIFRHVTCSINATPFMKLPDQLQR